MGLIADSSELPLIDIIQVKGSSRAACRILVNGHLGSGTLFLQGGDAVYASYAGLKGEPAAYAILSEEWVGYRVTSDVVMPAPNMRVDHRYLVMEAMRRLDEKEKSELPKSRPSVAANAPRLFRMPVLLLAAIGVITLVGAALLLFGGDAQATPDENLSKTASAENQETLPAKQLSPPPTNPVEADLLSRVGDALPVLSIGAPPHSPDPATGLRPTVVCRLLVDPTGNVVEARIYQHRTGLDAFEDAAVATVKQYHFQPARKDGAPVAVWINWPVDFI